MQALKDHFLLDPEVTFLNHGSFGATPREVLDVYQDWQRRLEIQPVLFLGRQIQDEFRTAREALALYLHTAPEDLVYLPNATFAVNTIARSLDFSPGDEVLITDQEYGACENVWTFMSQTKGLKVVKQPIPLPLPKDEAIEQIFWKGVSSRTRLIFLSHITSPTAVCLPVKGICRRARKAGIPVLVDGAHAPGQIPLDLTDLGADFYTGNCHKWMMAPKGSAFLYVRPELKQLIQPLVVSWGWGEDPPYPSDSRLQAVLEWWGTKDPAAYLSVPAAIDFQKEHNWDEVRAACQVMLAKALQGIEALTDQPSLYGKGKNRFSQVGAAFLPPACKAEELQSWLYNEYKIEVPVIQWQDRWLIRPSVQGYNTTEDLELLLEALGEYLQQGKSL